MRKEIEEHQKEIIYNWLNKQIKSVKLARTKLPRELNIYGSNLMCIYDKEIHIVGVIDIANALGIEYFRENWDGNEIAKRNCDEVWFYYKNFKFFELVEKGVKSCTDRRK